MDDNETMCGEQQPERTVEGTQPKHGRVHTCGRDRHRDDRHECWCNHTWVGARVELSEGEQR